VSVCNNVCEFATREHAILSFNHSSTLLYTAQILNANEDAELSIVGVSVVDFDVGDAAATECNTILNSNNLNITQCSF
jgi:hypothetical protein